MRLWTTFDYVQRDWTPAKNASLFTTVSGNSNLGALKSGLVPEKGTKAGQEDVSGGKQVETRICDRCGQRGHLKKAIPNLRRTKSGKDAATVEKDLDQGKRRIPSTIVYDQPRARTAASYGVMPLETTEHRTWNVV